MAALQMPCMHVSDIDDRSDMAVADGIIAADAIACAEGPLWW